MAVTIANVNQVLYPEQHSHTTLCRHGFGNCWDDLRGVVEPDDRYSSSPETMLQRGQQFISNPLVITTGDCEAEAPTPFRKPND